MKNQTQMKKLCKTSKKKKRKRGLPPETAQQNDFFKEMLQDIVQQLRSKMKEKEDTPPFRRLTCVAREERSASGSPRVDVRWVGTSWGGRETITLPKGRGCPVLTDCVTVAQESPPRKGRNTPVHRERAAHTRAHHEHSHHKGLESK